MKQNITVKPELKIKQTFNHQTFNSLKILSLNSHELTPYLLDIAKGNPFLSIDQYDSLSYDTKQESLYDHFKKELFMTHQNVDDEILINLISMLDSNGYFKEEPVDSKEIHILQRLEPKGCFSRNLKECLSVQCENHPNALLLCNYLNELANEEFNKITQETKLSTQEIQEAYAFIQALNPKPAAQFSKDASYSTCEIKINEDLSLEYLNSDIQIHFEDLKQVSEELREYRNEAKQIVSSLEKRRITLIQIMSVLCDIQKDFFLENKPLHHCTLHIVAQKCNLHPSTISRAIQNKNFEYKNRYYPIHSLFCHSNEDQIKNEILNIIKDEDISHPYSDEKIRKILENQNLHLSRRTIQKYREQMNIKNSTQRKNKA